MKLTNDILVSRIQWLQFLQVSGAKVVHSRFDELWNHSDPEVRKGWREAIRKEFNTLHIEKKCWFKVKKDQVILSKRPMKGKWVFAIKHDKDGNFLKYKARYVICGYAQEYFGKSYSPTIRDISVRLMSAIAARLKLHSDELSFLVIFFSSLA